jgi:hypothetical protein
MGEILKEVQTENLGFLDMLSDMSYNITPAWEENY